MVAANSQGDYAHYEAAFDDCLRAFQWPFIRVDEQRRAVLGGARIKSFDFVVHPPGGGARGRVNQEVDHGCEGQNGRAESGTSGWLVDVKGRHFPYHGRKGRRYWENWVKRDDLDGLRAWEDNFGRGYASVFVFAYWLTEPTRFPPGGFVYAFRGRFYAFVQVAVADYAGLARLRSSSWDTFSMSAGAFRRLARPVFRPPALRVDAASPSPAAFTAAARVL